MSKSRQPKKPKPHPLAAIREAVAAGIRSVIVGVSGGKDSVATLDLCCKHFERVQPYFMYTVKGLSFQEKYLAYLERVYHVDIWRMPDWFLSRFYRSGMFRHYTQQTRQFPVVKMADFDALLRRRSGLQWIAVGEKCIDSLERNAMIRKDGVVNHRRHRLFPLAYWANGTVHNYVKSLGLALPPDYNLLGGSFDGLRWDNLRPIREKYPDDYEKILKVFPFIEAQAVRFEGRKNDG